MKSEKKILFMIRKLFSVFLPSSVCIPSVIFSNLGRSIINSFFKTPTIESDRFCITK